MTELAHQLEEQQSKDGDSQRDSKDTDSSNYQRNERASSSEFDPSDFEDYRKRAFGPSSNGMTLSPSFSSSTEFDFSPTVTEMDPNVMFASHTQSMPNFSTWSMPKSQTSGLAMHFLQNAEALQGMSLMGQNMVESEFAIKPDILSCPNPDVMMGMSDPMIYGGFDSESMRL